MPLEFLATRLGHVCHYRRANAVVGSIGAIPNTPQQSVAQGREAFRIVAGASQGYGDQRSGSLRGATPKGGGLVLLQGIDS